MEVKLTGWGLGKNLLKEQASTMENSMVAPQKIKNRITVGFSNLTSGYKPKRIESKFSKRYLYNHVHSSVIHKNQKAETTQVTTGK